MSPKTQQKFLNKSHDLFQEAVCLLNISKDVSIEIETRVRVILEEIAKTRDLVKDEEIH